MHMGVDKSGNKEVSPAVINAAALKRGFFPGLSHSDNTSIKYIHLRGIYLPGKYVNKPYVFDRQIAGYASHGRRDEP